MTQEGPSLQVKYFCVGCAHLETENSVFYGENDDVDRSTSAKCKLLDKYISSYWYNHKPAPNWCPYLERMNAE